MRYALLVVLAACGGDDGAKWQGLLATQDLQALALEDLAVIDHGAAITLTNDCKR